MKKTLLTVLTLVLLLGTSSLAAESFWTGTYWGDPTGIAIQGTWQGTLYDDDLTAPYFEGKWAADDATQGYGTLYADLVNSEPGIYKVQKGTIYNWDGVEIGVWGGYFNLNDPIGNAEGEWKTFTDPNDPTAFNHGFWQGRSPFGE